MGFYPVEKSIYFQNLMHISKCLFVKKPSVTRLFVAIGMSVDK